jgi:hypothetical protein
VPICNQSGNIEFSYICRHLSRLYSVITMQLGFSAACFHVLTLFSCLKRVLVSLSVNRIQCFSMFVCFRTFAFYPLFRSKFSHWTFRILPHQQFSHFRILPIPPRQDVTTACYPITRRLCRIPVVVERVMSALVPCHDVTSNDAGTLDSDERSAAIQNYIMGKRISV